MGKAGSAKKTKSGTKLGPRLTDEQKRQINSLRRAGKKVSEIVRELGVKKHQVTHYVQTAHRKAGKVKRSVAPGTGLDSIHAKLKQAEKDAARYRKMLTQAVKREKDRISNAFSKKYGVK